MKTIRKVYKIRNQLTRILIALTVVAAPFLYVGHSSAAAMALTFVRFDRIQQNTATTGTVCVKPGSTSSTVASVVVTYPTGYTLGAYTTFTVDTTTNTASWPSGAIAWPGITAPASGGAISGQSVTFASSNLTSTSTIYCFNWTNSAAVKTVNSASSSNTGTVVTQTSVPAAIDTGSYAAPTIAGDQITVTATVNPIFSFVLSGTSDALGNLSTASVAVSPTPRTITIGTNAKNGWMAWAQSALTNGGLRSTTASYTIPSNCSSGAGTNSTLSAGTEGYNTGVTSSHSGGTGTITVATPFVGGSTGRGGGLCGNLQTIASSSGTGNTDILTLTNNAAIANSTPPATDYTDTITVTGAGMF